MNHAAARSLALSVLVATAGCTAGGARSTRLTDRDLDGVVQAMRASLAASDFFGQRDEHAEPAVIVLDRIENLTGDLLTRAERWMLVARVQGALPIRELAGKKNIAFQITPERHALLRKAGFAGDLETAPQATHLMTATFHSARRAGRDTRTGLTDRRADYYYFEYRITEVRTRRLAWTDSFEIKREAVGLVID